jgi:hypothetical protein
VRDDPSEERAEHGRGNDHDEERRLDIAEDVSDPDVVAVVDDKRNEHDEDDDTNDDAEAVRAASPYRWFSVGVSVLRHVVFVPNQS